MGDLGKWERELIVGRKQLTGGRIIDLGEIGGKDAAKGFVVGAFN